MVKVIGVRFRSGCRIYYFDPQELEIPAGESVIVETARGQEFGDVVQGVTELDESQVVMPLKPVIRLATDTDRSMRETNALKEGDAFIICQQKIEKHRLDMKLVDVEYAFNGSKVLFYFTADERVDFRELVKDLAAQFRTRIELRQIGVRDEAKMLGGLGTCGRPICCKAFLDDFRPVSIKMAKEQNLSLSPTKISGLCGRLMCCLQYEQASYEEMKRRMPRVNGEVLTPDGLGVAIESNVITEKTRVRLTMPDGSIEVRAYHYEELAKPGESLPKRRVDASKEAATPAETMSNHNAVPESAESRAKSLPQSNAQSGGRHHRRGGRGHTGQGGQDGGRSDEPVKPMPDKQPDKMATPQQLPKRLPNGRKPNAVKPNQKRRYGSGKPKPQNPQNSGR